MQKNNFLKSNSIFIKTLLIALPSSVFAQTDKPNIILITADDLGFQLSCYGDKHIKTTNIDALANSGIRFDKAYVTQGCSSPSRSSILTGLYPHQNGQIGLAKENGFEINNNVNHFLPNILKANGYRTGIIGKLHVNQPQLFDFDFIYRNYDYNITRDVENVANTAIDFMTKDKEPFFLYINYVDPHVPFPAQVKGIPATPFGINDVSEWPFQNIGNKEQLKRIADYYSAVKRLDVGIGMLLDKIRENNLEENTLIIFISDNGICFSRGKTTCYEMGVKVPMIISWKNHILPNQVSKSLVSSVDIFPTICEIANIKTPSELEGTPLNKLFKSSNTKHRDYIFTEYTYHSRNHYFPRRAITDGRYKLIYNILGDTIKNPLPDIDGDKAYLYAIKYGTDNVKKVFNKFVNPGLFELYDLQNDPYETNDLSSDNFYNNIKEGLKIELIKWMRETNDPFFDRKYSVSLISQ